MRFLSACCNTTLNVIFAYLFSPFGYLLGFESQEALAIGQLLGTKVAVNELIAYGEMLNMPVLSDRAVNLVDVCIVRLFQFLLHRHSSWWHWCIGTRKEKIAG